MASAEPETTSPCPHYASVTDRYYTKRYKVRGKVSGEDHCILCHSNKLSIVTLAPSHPINRDGKKVVKVDFKVSDEIDRLQNKAVGKSKKGAQALTENSPLCHVTCDDDVTYTVYSCVRGQLLEVNERLVTSPGLLTSRPDAEGYVAIILSKLTDAERHKNSLLSAEAYQQFLSASQTVTPDKATASGGSQ